MEITAILLSAVSVVAISAIWYSRFLFGNAMASSVSVADINGYSWRSWLRVVLWCVIAVLVSWILTRLNYALQFSDWRGALSLGFWCWIGFVLPPIVAIYIVERRSVKLLFIHAIFWIIAFLVSAQIIVVLTSSAFSGALGNEYSNYEYGAPIDSESVGPDVEYYDYE